MNDLLDFINAHAIWIYGILGVISLIALRATFSQIHAQREAFFGLERKRAAERLARSSIMFALTLAAFAVVIILYQGFSKNLDTREVVMVIPTVSLLAGTQTVDNSSIEPVFSQTTPFHELDPAGCLNLQATIIFPEENTTVSGILEIKGTANIVNFAFYKIEYKSIATDSIWRSIYADSKPCPDSESELGIWNTNLVTAGEYALRLVVTDTAGNASLPCVITIEIEASE